MMRRFGLVCRATPLRLLLWLMKWWPMRCGRGWSDGFRCGSGGFGYPDRRRTGVRAALEGVLFVARIGIGWNQLPTGLFGASGATCWQRLAEWHEAGVSKRLHEQLPSELRAAGQLELSNALVDSSHLRALKAETTPAPAPSTEANPAPSTT